MPSRLEEGKPLSFISLLSILRCNMASFNKEGTISPDAEKFSVHDFDTPQGLPVKRNVPWYGYVWDAFGKEKDERNFILKLDSTLLIFSVLYVHLSCP